MFSLLLEPLTELRKRAKSTADFINKLKNVEEEVDPKVTSF